MAYQLRGISKPSFKCMQGLFWKGNIFNYYLGHIMTEVYKDRVYASLIEGKKDNVIVDIGAHIGLTSYYFSQFSKKVYSIEPAKEHFEVLKYMVDYNKLTNIELFNFAISNKEGEQVFYHNTMNDMNNTTFSLHNAAGQAKTTETVKTIPLDKFFNDNKIDHVDFLKMDIEGEEYNVLSSEGFRKVADRIKLMVIELHAWPTRHINQAESVLKDNGFKIDLFLTKQWNDPNILVARR